MPAAVIPIRQSSSAARSGEWSLVEIARPGHMPEALGILLIDTASDTLALRLRHADDFEDLEEAETDLIEAMADDLRHRAEEHGARALIESLEDSFSWFLRIGDRTAIEFHGSAQAAADRLFARHVSDVVEPFVTHLPLYTLRAAATKFGEEMTSGEAGAEWVRVPEGMRITEDMFVAQVVGRSMEPLIPDGSLCVFRAGVAGSRQGKRLLIEQFGQTDYASRYTVKRYTSVKRVTEDGEWQHERIRLEPLNRAFEAFDLGPDDFRVIGEFVAVLES